MNYLYLQQKEKEIQIKSCKEQEFINVEEKQLINQKSKLNVSKLRKNYNFINSKILIFLFKDE